MVQHIYSVYLKKKMQYEMEKSASIEEAFQKLKSTGLTDVNDIVQKFLT